MITPDVSYPLTADGWQLELRHYHDEARRDPSRRPLLFLPGYGMNSFILGYHPSGVSMVEYLVQRGFDVWTVNMRGQGGARRVGGPRRIGFRELSLIDVPRAIDAVLEARPGAEDVSLVGCSLGASIAYSYLAHNPRDNRVGALVAIGGPLRWRNVHPLLEVAFSSPALVGKIPFYGTRKLARAALPVAQRFPSLLSIYMNAAQIDLSRADDLVQTVDDPIPYLNRQIAHWVRSRDLVVGGVNVSEGLGQVDDVALLCVLANRDGVVPPEAALSVIDHIGEGPVDVLVAGDEDRWFAHADLFISDHAEQIVFAPMASWLEEHG